VGSIAGVSAIAAGSAHVASSHVDPSVVRREAKGPVNLFGLYAREQGILAREAFYLVIPASFMAHRRVTQFLELVVEELTTEARRELPGYSFEALGRVQPLVPETEAPQ
jgi:molybdate-binding protein